LKAKELEKIKTLTEEWRKRDKEREILTKKKVSICISDFLKKCLVCDWLTAIANNQL
jgi:hypothetical protein